MSAAAASNPFKARAAVVAKNRQPLIMELLMAELPSAKKKQLLEALRDCTISYEVLAAQLADWGYPMCATTVRKYCLRKQYR